MTLAILCKYTSSFASPPTFSHTLNAKPLKCLLGKLYGLFIDCPEVHKSPEFITVGNSIKPSPLVNT